MERIYRYDLSKLVRRLTPPRWRTPFNLHWYECLLSGINYSQDAFNSYKNQALIEVHYDGTTLMLEKMLNDKFDSVQRRILITHGNEDNVFLYNESEGEVPTYLFNESESGVTSGYSETYIYSEGENSTGLPDGVHFRVIAPASLSSEELRMKKEIDKLKQAGRQYDVQFT